MTDEIKAGDRTAMKKLYDLHAGFLTAVCSRYISDREEVRDVLQDSFIKIFQSIGQFTWRGEGSLRAWMTRIVINESLKSIRRTSRESWLIRPDDCPGNEIPDQAEEDLDIGDLPPGALHEMIRRLPVGYRTIFNLYVLEGKSHKEIASLLDIKENSSASQLHRAKALLAGWIRQYRKEH